jgi:hypothetical protein
MVWQIQNMLWTHIVVVFEFVIQMQECANGIANSKTTDVNTHVCFLKQLLLHCGKHLAPNHLLTTVAPKHFSTIPAHCCAGVIAYMLHYEVFLPPVPTILTARPP